MKKTSKEKALEKHNALRDILINFGNQEYGDCIIDEITQLFDYPTTLEVEPEEGETYTEKLENLWEKMRLDIDNEVKEIGKESNFTTEKTIKVNCCNDVVLGNGGTLTEISQDHIYDEDGYSYNYSVLQYQDLAELIDYLNSL